MKTRIILLLCLAVCLVMGTMCVPAFADQEGTRSSGDYTYTLLEDGTAEITKYLGRETALEIPALLDGYIVTSIGEGAFYKRERLETVTIPDSVTRIGENAFNNCTGMQTVNIPGSVTIIDKQAFAHLPNGRYNASIVFNNSIYTTINDKLTIDVYNSQVGLDDEPPVTANA